MVRLIDVVDLRLEPLVLVEHVLTRYGDLLTDALAWVGRVPSDPTEEIELERLRD